jgi:hypothetical protein
MAFDATDEGTLLAELPHPTDPHGPRAQVRAVQTRFDLPSTWVPEAGILGSLARQGSPQLTGLAPPEREALLGVLLTALWRSTYHRGRFVQYVDAAHARYEHYEGRLFADTVAQAILFETQALLTAIRAIVEGVAYIGGRRAGDDPAAAEERIHRIKRDTNPEALVLQQHKAWFEELTAYRNALVHRGVPEVFGYVPATEPNAPQAPDRTFNVMLVPDRASIAQPNRPDSWTYNEGRRLEVLVRDLWTELLAFTREVGTCWGFAMPADTTPPPMAHHGSTIVVLPGGAVAQRK